MNASDFFYYSAGIGVWIVIMVWIVIGVQLYRILRSVGKTAEKVREGAEEVVQLKAGVQSAIAGTFYKFLRMGKGGEGDGYKKR